MAARLAYYTLIPDTFKALLDLTSLVKSAGLEIKLVDLIFQRVSQINGCAYCVDMHWRDLLAQGEDLQRLNSLMTWQEVDFFSERERAALNWAECVTNIKETQAPDADYEMLHEYFSDTEIAALTAAIALMNMWNRLGISFRLPVVRRKVALD